MNNSKVFLTSSERQKLDTAVHILLDCSGSMQGQRLNLASQACYALADALQGMQINIGVSAFPANIYNGTDNTIKPIVKHGERVNNLFNMSASGYTPLAPALWWVLQQMLPLRENRKMILIITDGEPNSYVAVEKAVEGAQNIGVELYGLGILTNAIKDILPKSSKVIQELKELSPALFELLRNALIKGKS